MNVYNFETKIKQGGFNRLKNVVEKILLRPNDIKLFMGEEKYNNYVKATEKILNEDYKEHEIYKYYYELPKVEHGFCTFERWKNGLLF